MYNTFSNRFAKRGEHFSHMFVFFFVSAFLYDSCPWPRNPNPNKISIKTLILFSVHFSLFYLFFFFFFRIKESRWVDHVENVLFIYVYFLYASNIVHRTFTSNSGQMVNIHDFYFRNIIILSRYISMIHAFYECNIRKSTIQYKMVWH